MTYLAPRQGLFAIILLISFCIQSLLLVISTERQLDEVRMQTGERMMTQLIDEAKLPLISQDRVSLSVIAARYTADDDVANLTIRNPEDVVLVQTGSAPLQDGNQIKQIATSGDKALGTVTLTLTSSNKGEIIATQWPFLLGSLILNLLIWLLYGYVARPTKAQLAALSRDIRNHFISQQPRARRLRRDENPEDIDTMSQQDGEDQKVDSDKDTSDPAVMAALLGHSSLAAQAEKQKHSMGLDESSKNSSSQPADSKMPTAETKNIKNDDSSLGLNKELDKVCVYIHYVDQYNLITALAPEKSIPYFALCTQLLQQGIDEVLAQPLFHGISVANEPKFDAQGAKVLLQASNSHTKIGLAAVVLGKLYVMLNQIIVAKHHELKQFAANVKVGVSGEEQEKSMMQLIGNVGKEDEVMTLLPAEGVKQLSGHIQLRSLPNPMTVYERECGFVDGMNEVMVQRLVTMRDAVLLKD